MDRALVCSGGSIVTMCSNMGISVRCLAICSVMSSPSGVNGSGVNGPITATHDEKFSLSRYTALAASQPVTASTPLWIGQATGSLARMWS
jgi:hypothetical protein